VNLWAYRNIQMGPSIAGIGDSPYEAFIWLCLLCVLGSLFTRNRATWLLVAGLVGIQVVVSAFLAGSTARYAVPVRPVLFLFPSLLVIVPGWLAEVMRGRRANLNLADAGAVEGHTQ
jgi:hypothetical protein